VYLLLLFFRFFAIYNNDTNANKYNDIESPTKRWTKSIKNAIIDTWKTN
jgi:hypothetical protein